MSNTKTKGRQFRRVAEMGRPIAHFGEHTFTFDSDWAGPMWVEYLVRREEGTAAQIVTEWPDDDGEMQPCEPAPWIHRAIFAEQYPAILEALSGQEIEALGEMLLLVFVGTITVAAFNGDEVADETDPQKDSESTE